MPVVINGTTGVTTAGVTNTGTDDAAIQTYGGVAMPRMVLSTAQNTTSGTSIDFTSIPNWVKRITVMFNGVSTSGTSSVQVQIGAGSVTTTGYVSLASYGTTAGTFTTSTTGFITDPTNVALAAVSRIGTMSIVLVGSNIWVESASVYQVTANITSACAGNVTLSGTLDRLRLTTVGGTDTFDAGSVNIMYEG
jgi:hypothetical protein